MSAADLVDLVRRHWMVGVVVLVLAGAANLLFDPDWNRLQMASGAAEFRRLSTDTSSVVGAALSDVVFAGAYGALGYIGLRTFGRANRVTATLSVLVVVGAVCDELENVTLLANLARRSSLTDGWVSVMRIPGTLKWLAAPGVIVLHALLAVRAARRLKGASP